MNLKFNVDKFDTVITKIKQYLVCLKTLLGRIMPNDAFRQNYRCKALIAELSRQKLGFLTALN